MIIKNGAYIYTLYIFYLPIHLLLLRRLMKTLPHPLPLHLLLLLLLLLLLRFLFSISTQNIY